MKILHEFLACQRKIMVVAPKRLSIKGIIWTTKMHDELFLMI